MRKLTKEEALEISDILIDPKVNIDPLNLKFHHYTLNVTKSEILLPADIKVTSIYYPYVCEGDVVKFTNSTDDKILNSTQSILMYLGQWFHDDQDYKTHITFSNNSFKEGMKGILQLDFKQFIVDKKGVVKIKRRMIGGGEGALRKLVPKLKKNHELDNFLFDLETNFDCTIDTSKKVQEVIFDEFNIKDLRVSPQIIKSKLLHSLLKLLFLEIYYLEEKCK